MVLHEGHICEHGLALDVVGDTYNSSLGDSLVRIQDAFNLRCAYAVARHIDHVVNAPRNPLYSVLATCANDVAHSHMHTPVMTIFIAADRIARVVVARVRLEVCLHVALYASPFVSGPPAKTFLTSKCIPCANHRWYAP